MLGEVQQFCHHKLLHQVNLSTTLSSSTTNDRVFSGLAKLNLHGPSAKFCGSYHDAARSSAKADTTRFRPSTALRAY
ncbi:hypothetical protein CBOM_08038 [Ceraceosorus bombacis]|uniref:Uncharacterized protein n=1 Tax=Ceraceosorus bombacis TaxID=401625 RepID=A0A0P1BL99_9BASI|nr:hypothetical protein CBOM_08038 [Ceraceosorus bombacis]